MYFHDQLGKAYSARVCTGFNGRGVGPLHYTRIAMVECSLYNFMLNDV